MQGGNVCYVASGGKQYFLVGDVLSDFGDSAETNFSTLVNGLGGETKEGLSENKSDPNGVGYQTAYLLTSRASDTVLVGLVFCEQKDLALIVMGIYDNEKYADSTYDELSRICESIEFKDTPDIVTGRTFYMDMEGLTAELHNDGTFLLYQDKNKVGAEHISGTYEVYRGREAVEKVDSLTEYGLTADEQKMSINSAVEFWDDYYAVIFYATEAVQSGEPIEASSTILYVGYADKSHEALAMTSCNRFLNETWTYAE